MQARHFVFALLLFAIALGAPNPGGRRCGTPAPPTALTQQAQSFQVQEAQQGSLPQGSGIIPINIYFHVVSASNNLADGNVPDTQLQQQLSYMNKAYGLYGFQFKLVSTDRTINANWANNIDEYTMKNTLRKGNYQDLNVYFLKAPGGANSGLLGISTFPTTVTTGNRDYILDGVIVLYSTVPGGSMTNFNLGGTLVHEVGHWLGLFHTFQGLSCSGDGDSISDTPQQSTATQGCPTTKDSCPNVAGRDAVQNYMDYSDDSCLTQFTTGQSVRMKTMWNQYRIGK